MDTYIKSLSKRITKEYSISANDYSESNNPVVIIKAAYSSATDLFDPDSDNSISTSTLAFYMKHLDEALEIFTKDMSNIEAATSLLSFFFNVQTLINSGADTLKQKLSSELLNNKDYYQLFAIDYFLELSKTDGLNTALSELEEDVNIRANTYYKTAYKEYLDILPGFEEIINKYININ